MHSNLLSLLTLLATLAIPTLAQNGPYFVLGSGMPVSIQRLDPILSPGRVSGHVHSVVGSNAFSPTMDFASSQSSTTCSTIRLIPDKSAYWMPALYFHATNGSFIRVPEKPDHRIYYKFGKGDNTPDLERSEFPQGFRMISGSANLRHDDGSMGVGGNQLNWVCHDGGSNPKATGFPKGFSNCDNYGFAASMRFPSCWSGRDFDPAHPLAHMDFPTNQDGLAGCREGYKAKRFAEIFVEYYLNVKSFNGLYGSNDIPWTLAQGDPTGYGFHMDFVSFPSPSPHFPSVITLSNPPPETTAQRLGTRRSCQSHDNMRHRQHRRPPRQPSMFRRWIPTLLFRSRQLPRSPLRKRRRRTTRLDSHR